MIIGIIGVGTVGKALYHCFSPFVEVRCDDIVPERCTHSREDVLRSDLVMVCLPTPALPSGDLDISVVEAEIAGIAFTNPKANVVIRSTVPIGTTQALRERCGLQELIHSPEFLTSRTANTDALLPTRNIVGGLPGKRLSTAEQLLVELYNLRFPGCPIHLMTSDESEAVKLFVNAFFAVKIAFFNEIQALTFASGLDWRSILSAVLADGRISHSHTSVPGPDGKYGFGGQCLPKDLSCLITSIKRQGLPASVTEGAMNRNVWDRGRGHQ